MQAATEQPIGSNLLTERTRTAKRRFEEMWRDPIAAKQNWQRIAFLEGIALILAICWVGYLGKLPKQIPYVLDRDKAGNISYAGPAQPIDMDAQTWNLVKIAALKQFLESWRTVTMDRTAQVNDWDRAFVYIGQGSPAKKVMDQWYEQNDPIQRLNKGQLVSVQFKTFDVQGDHTFGLWWEETTTSLTGQVTTQKQWRARVVYTLHIPSSEQAREENSLGLLITELSWQEVQ